MLSSVQIFKQSAFTRAMATSVKLPFKKVMAANRGEIALRIMRASQELGIPTVGIYSYEDRFGLHRTKADQSFLLDRKKSPIAQYLDINYIVKIAKENGVSAVHPGYGFLSENATFADAVEKAGMTFVGPTVDNLRMFADKTTAREHAIKHNIPVVPGTPGPIGTYEEAKKICDKIGFPIIIKAAFGGGGKGMRVVNKMEDLKDNFSLASREALAAFGNGTVFIERYVAEPRHIEIQVLGDGTGNVIHLFERDCSVQRRHQKVIENAPAYHLDPQLRDKIADAAVYLCKTLKYRNAGTVEFLVDKQGRFYFMEVNPRVQVEHTVTEEVTGIDIVQTQLKIAAGYTLNDLGLTQDKIKTRGYAIQARITTENPSNNFQPDTGVITAYREATGQGVRLDGVGYQGLEITPHYDSLLVKLTCRGATYQDAVNKLHRALTEYRVRGVNTNVPFLLNLLEKEQYLEGKATTFFIAQNPDLLDPRPSKNRGQKTLQYLGNLIVNGHPSELGATGPAPAKTEPLVPATPNEPMPTGFRQIYKEQGPKAFAKAVRDHKGLLLTDTTWRDAHQSLLATRMRTRDILAIAPYTAHAFNNLYSLECWGGATFDVAMRFLHEDPWERLALMREQVPNIPFQMLLRGANAVGYSAYPDNVNYKFCDLAVKTGMDVFRVFDSLNYIENMRLGIDCVGSAGGIIEATLCYTGDCANPNEKKYTIDYYLETTRKLVDLGIHVLAIKDMAGLLTPQSARLLVSSIRKEYPNLPIHIHTHDTAGTGVTSMIACGEAGADAVDVAIDSMSGMTSQPSMGAVVSSLRGTPLDTGIDHNKLTQINDYWSDVRGVYAPFECGQKSGSSDVYDHEMPGGQYTNLMYQSQQLGLTGQWPLVKKAYEDANDLCGDIIKVTPSSKVVGDFANFMVQNKLTKQDVLAKADELNFPTSVVEYFQGYLGIPEPWGFNEEVRSKIIKGKKLPNGKDRLTGRPGAEMPPYDLEGTKAKLQAKYGKDRIQDTDVISYALYPRVFDDWMTYEKQYGDVSKIPTRYFLRPMTVGEETCVTIENGKDMYINYKGLSEVNKKGEREVNFTLNGLARSVIVKDTKSGVTIKVNEKATDKAGSVGSPMTGAVVEITCKPGQKVKAGQSLVILSAAKMETIVSAPCNGTLKRILAVKGEKMETGDLLVEIEEEKKN
ncbi:hypothetical protein WA158_008283 [Blastocystis sp. Blastoise]